MTTEDEDYEARLHRAERLMDQMGCDRARGEDGLEHWVPPMDWAGPEG